MRQILPSATLAHTVGRIGESPCPGGGSKEGAQPFPRKQKDRMRSGSDESCPARPCVRAKRGTYTVGLLASPLVPMDIGAGSMTQIYRYQRTWRAQ